MLHDRIIEPCCSPYSSAIVIAKKKDGKNMFCIDFRKLNQITEDTAQPIPKIHEELKELGKARIFTSLDLKSGFWQVPLEEKGRPYIAFSTPEVGTYQFRVMPFGLKNVSSTFQRLMTQLVLKGFINTICKVYIDNVIIFSDTWEKH